MFVGDIITIDNFIIMDGQQFVTEGDSWFANVQQCLLINYGWEQNVEAVTSLSQTPYFKNSATYSTITSISSAGVATLSTPFYISTVNGKGIILDGREHPNFSSTYGGWQYGVCLSANESGGTYPIIRDPSPPDEHTQHIPVLWQSGYRAEPYQTSFPITVRYYDE